MSATLFGAELGFVPYVMPGFALAKAAADVFDRDPTSKASSSTSTASSPSARAHAKPMTA